MLRESFFELAYLVDDAVQRRARHVFAPTSRMQRVALRLVHRQDPGAPIGLQAVVHEAGDGIVELGDRSVPFVQSPFEL